ncbi:MAG: hypothetical protein RLZZ387_5313 [Chloroflexota bacterium]|jgi:hypothetical protein
MMMLLKYLPIGKGALASACGRLRLPSALCLLPCMFALALVGCGAQPLLGDVALSRPGLSTTGAGETVALSYEVGRPASVTVYLQDAAGARYTLREAEQRLASDEPYTLRFDGTAPTDDPVLRRRALPSGAYTVVVEVAGADGEQARRELPLTIEASDAPPPAIENLVIFPQTISPNADAIDDVAEITYRTAVTATVDIEVVGPGCTPLCPFVTAQETEPTPQRHAWNGRTPDGALLPNGEYTVVVRARDRFGNLVEQRSPVAIAGAGLPEATITYAYIAPQAIMRGDVITVTMRVKNTGDVPLRTYGPPSGYEYSTDEVFSSVEEGAYASKSGGFWRIGVDWDANSGGAAKRYPYRWAITPRPPEEWKVPFQEDVLMPGEEAEIVGRIRVLQQENKMGFYTGLIQDGVGFFQDRTGRTIIEVGF